MLEVGARVREWKVTSIYESSLSSDLHEMIAEDDAGARVLLRVPSDLDAVQRIRQEADLAKRHVHETIVACQGIVEHNGWPVQVVEHVDGLSLDVIALVAGALPPAALCRVGRQVALALVELHERPPIVHHGALSAERIVIDGGGNARLADVGRARPQNARRLVSPERRAASPEMQGLAGKPSAADDLWALGMILAECALGHPLEVGDKHLDPKLLAGMLPDRLIDALAVLTGPINARLTNATAAVRMFTELNKKFGDGALVLRTALQHARLGSAFGGFSRPGDITDDGDDDHPVTDPDNTDKSSQMPFRAILSDAGKHYDPENPKTIEVPNNPHTVEMSADAVLALADLRKLAAAQENRTPLAPPPGITVIPSQPPSSIPPPSQAPKTVPPPSMSSSERSMEAEHEDEDPRERRKRARKVKKNTVVEDIVPMRRSQVERLANVSGAVAAPPSPPPPVEVAQPAPAPPTPDFPPPADPKPDLDDLSEDEIAAINPAVQFFTGRAMMFVAAGVGVAVLLAIAFVLGMTMK